MPVSDIVIKGAREHNLRNIDLVLPRNQLICLTGVSGSGKSSLAFDTLYAEGQRRYVESLSSFARQFLGQMPKPEVDLIAGLSPSISISQKTSGRNPRSTVGTITEIYDYLRVLYARVGQGFCPKCHREITAQTREQIIARVLLLPAGTRFLVLAPLIRGQKGEYKDLFDDLRKQGFARARLDGQIVQLSQDQNLDRQMRHDIEVVVDRLAIKGEIRPRLAEAIDLALKLGQGNLIIATETEEAEEATPAKRRKRGAARPGDMIMSVDYACTDCGVSFEPPSPQLFSFNSPQGMCLECDGLGQRYDFDPDLLIPDPALSFKKGAIAPIGLWKEMGRWRRHIYQGVADTVERLHELPEKTLLETPWKKLDPALQQLLLQGTDDLHITYTWRRGRKPVKYGGVFEGIVPTLLARYKSSKSSMQLRYLEKFMRTLLCPACHGERLNPQARSVRITTANPDFGVSPAKVKSPRKKSTRSRGKTQSQLSLTLPEICGLSVADAAAFFEALELDATRATIASEAIKEIRGRLGFLLNVGLDYLALDRTAPTLSGGESQRIRLAGQIGSGLVGVLYILDEPSIGLHPRDNDRLLDTLARLRDMGNTVVVVEHDEDTMRAADHIIDFGPGPGVRGGEVVVAGTYQQVVKEARSVTGGFLSGREEIAMPAERREGSGNKLSIVGATHNNLKGIDVDIPLGTFVCVTGVSGSGKSSLVNDILVEALRRDLNGGDGAPGDHKQITGLEHLDKLIAIDQSPIGRTPRSNPGTYIKVFDDIRNLFCEMPEAKRRGYKPGRFSFNVAGGRCEACEGNGSNRLEMDFLADVWVTCPICEGARFNRETLQVKFKDYSIADLLQMDVQQALVVFDNIPKIRHKLQTLHDVGLDYLKIGQPSPTLSGGEAQRIKLARELVKTSTGKTLYLLDEPTTGLHFADIKLLLDVLHKFADQGNTVLVVEHNLDVIKTADWVIDLGPEGGEDGGQIIAQGPPETIAKTKGSHTGKSLAPILAKAAGQPVKAVKRRAKKARQVELATKISVRGARQHNLKEVQIDIARDKMTVFCGPSGSGKSSLAMDTIYAEGQRRYVESLSSYARQFISQMQKPSVDQIEGLSPAIAIEQKNLGNTPRSTVGTVTEVYDYFRILMARLGTPYCPDCDREIGTQTPDEIVDKILSEPEGSKLYLMAPVEIEVGQEYERLWEELKSTGYARVRIDGETHSLENPPEIDRRRKHAVEVVVDRIKTSNRSRSRIAESVEQALSLGRGVLTVAYPLDGAPESRWKVVRHSQHLACDRCGRSFERLTPHNFSFNSSLGWCDSCEGLGIQRGANPAALLRDPKLTLAEGAVALWPSVADPVSQQMLQALSLGTGLPLDKPFEQLSARNRRLVMHGAGEQWFAVGEPEQRPRFRFQFKGLYPAIEEASRLSGAFRNRLSTFIDEVECAACGGSRLRDDSAAVRFESYTIDDLCRMPLGELRRIVKGWKFKAREKRIAGEVVREIQNRVQFLNDVGLEYLSIGRGAATLSNGEAQRIRLASQLGSGLCGVLYVLDEPTIGLHPRDNTRLLKALHKLRDLGNTLLIVEHDREVIAESDYLADFGPQAGTHGGQIVANGTPAQVARRKTSVTGPYLSGKKAISIPSNRRMAENGVGHPEDQWVKILGARRHNLQNINVEIPLGALTAVTGPSGCGKSSLIEDVLFRAVARTLHRAAAIPGAHDEIRGLDQINKVIRVDQQPLGNSPTSNPATYTGVFETIRQLFSQLPESKVRGYSPRRFSFNAPGGRCETCAGNGQLCIEMHFLPDVWVQCETCRGERYNPETLAVKYRGRSIAEVLDMTCGDAVELFSNIPKIRRILQTLCDVGLDYLTLGQAAPTLSGGEAQRVKLAAELSRPDTGRTLYLLDEPTTGLHFDDLAKLLEVLHRLVDLGNTVVLIEHNLDVIKQADWMVDMGPEAGAGGGRVVVAGTPEQVVAHAQQSSAGNGYLRSHTGEALLPVLAAGPYARRVAHDPNKLEEKEGDLAIEDLGQDAQMPWETNGRRWHTQDRVGRKGEPVAWEGQILSEVVDRIHALGEFSETDWKARSVVEIAAAKKSDGWFLHAITGEAWLLKLKFRVASGAFDADELDGLLGLKPLNQMHDLPVYGNEPRVKCKATRGPWQEVQVAVHSFEEIDTPAFWRFVEEATESFLGLAEEATQSGSDFAPWKLLGRKWHLMRKGFPTNKTPRWEVDTLEQLVTLLEQTAPEGSFVWTNQQIVNFFLPEQKEPWAVLHTKKPAAVELTLTGRKGSIALGRLTGIGRQPAIDASRPRLDQLKLRFRTLAEVQNQELASVLGEHRNALRNGD
ncbi:excinuclease ABC subunit UvrA [Lignipirellula cremea]|uniref:UvrABC system protein A n=1 Tax=Lignipirellula cremea TaxID=2528010 RepID=A0A518DWQ5_9BACT|nr:excinuclease ABC subunit UvrA [Lignipirellula cremea]QDU96275.1 UvrABC system protein A [Lignipirellula cremea]